MCTHKTLAGQLVIFRSTYDPVCRWVWNEVDSSSHYSPANWPNSHKQKARGISGHKGGDSTCLADVLARARVPKKTKTFSKSKNDDIFSEHCFEQPRIKLLLIFRWMKFRFFSIQIYWVELLTSFKISCSLSRNFNLVFNSKTYKVLTKVPYKDISLFSKSTLRTTRVFFFLSNI